MDANQGYSQAGRVPGIKHTTLSFEWPCFSIPSMILSECLISIQIMVYCLGSLFFGIKLILLILGGTR